MAVVGVGAQSVWVRSVSGFKAARISAFDIKSKHLRAVFAGSRSRQRRRTDLQLGASPTAGGSGGFGGPSGAGAVTTEIEGEKAEVPTRLEAATEKA